MFTKRSHLNHLIFIVHWSQSPVNLLIKMCFPLRSFHPLGGERKEKKKIGVMPKKEKKLIFLRRRILLKWNIFPMKWMLTQHNGILIKSFHNIFPKDYLHFKNCLLYLPQVMLNKINRFRTRVTFSLHFWVTNGCFCEVILSHGNLPKERIVYS